MSFQYNHVSWQWLLRSKTTLYTTYIMEIIDILVNCENKLILATFVCQFNSFVSNSQQLNIGVKFLYIKNECNVILFCVIETHYYLPQSFLDDHRQHNKYGNQDLGHNMVRQMVQCMQYLKRAQDLMYHKKLRIHHNEYVQKTVQLSLIHTYLNNQKEFSFIFKRAEVSSKQFSYVHNTCG